MIRFSILVIDVFNKNTNDLNKGYCDILKNKPYIDYESEVSTF